MMLFWTIPVFREALFLDWLSAKLIDPIRNTRFDYWLLDPDGQFHTLQFALILAFTIWAFYSYTSSREPRHAAHRPPPETSLTRRQRNATFARSPQLRPATSIYNRLIAKNSPRASANPFTHGDVGRTGRLSTPGYQTPFSVRTHAPNFSRLAKDAPVNYETLQDIGMLDQDGTPTKKWTGKQGVRGDLFGNSKGKERVTYDDSDEEQDVRAGKGKAYLTYLDAEKDERWRGGREARRHNREVTMPIDYEWVDGREGSQEVGSGEGQ